MAPLGCWAPSVLSSKHAMRTNSSHVITTKTRLSKASAFIRTGGEVACGAGDAGGVSTIIPLWAGPSPIPGGLGTSLQGEASRLSPEAGLRHVPQGRSPPAEASHGPDSAARVPGGIDVRGWEGKGEGRTWVWVVCPRHACAVHSRGWQGPVRTRSAPPGSPAHGCPPAQAMLGPPVQQGHPEGVTRPVLVCGELRETGIQTHQHPLPPHPGTWARVRKGQLWPRPPSQAGSDPLHCVLCKGRGAGEPVTGPLCGKAW